MTIRATPRVFWFHYRKVDGKMTVHFRGKCLVVDEVDCTVPCATKRNKTQPKLVMRGKANCIHIRHINDKVVGYIS